MLSASLNKTFPSFLPAIIIIISSSSSSSSSTTRRITIIIIVRLEFVFKGGSFLWGVFGVCVRAFFVGLSFVYYYYQLIT